MEMPNMEVLASQLREINDTPTKLMFWVYDQAADAFVGDPFFEATYGTAERAFAAAVLKEGHQFNMHADDYALYHVGAISSYMSPDRPSVAGVKVTRITSGRQVLMQRQPAPVEE